MFHASDNIGVSMISYSDRNIYNLILYIYIYANVYLLGMYYVYSVDIGNI